MKKMILWLLCSGLLAGCSSVSVQRDYDTSVDFFGLKTFAWQYDKQPETGIPQIDNDLNDERIRRAINAALATKGLRLVPRAEADLFVAYFVDQQRKLNSGSVSVGMGRSSYGRHGSVGYNTGVSEYDQAILTIDLLAPADEKMIWRGVGTRVAYEGSNPDKFTEIVNEAVSKILKKFPPTKR